MREEAVTWGEFEKLMDHLMSQFYGAFDALLMVTRGGIVPGGMIAEARNIKYVLTAAVHFSDVEEKLLAWPTFLQFPEDELLEDRRVLIIDDVWDSGRTVNTVRGRVENAGARPEVAVVHYKPGQSMFKTKPEYYAAVTDAYIIYPWEAQGGLEGVLGRLEPTPSQ